MLLDQRARPARHVGSDKNRFRKEDKHECIHWDNDIKGHRKKISERTRWDHNIKGPSNKASKNTRWDNRKREPRKVCLRRTKHLSVARAIIARGMATIVVVTIHEAITHGKAHVLPAQQDHN